MKKVILSLAVVAAMGLTSCNSDTKKNDQNPEKLEVKNKITQTKTSFGIRGNCSIDRKSTRLNSSH